MTIPYFEVLAFTDRLFAGNPAGVCILNEWLPDDLLQRIAAENKDMMSINGGLQSPFSAGPSLFDHRLIRSEANRLGLEPVELPRRD